MSAEIKFDSEKEVVPEDIMPHPFRIPSIVLGYGSYDLQNLGLPDGWETFPKKLTEWNCARLCEMHFKGFDNPEIKIDKKTGIITSVRADKNKQSRAYLDTSLRLSNGTYVFSKVDDLSEAIAYQRLLANYLSFMTGFEVNYSYIINGGYNEMASSYLTIPESVMKLPKPVTNGIYQKEFEKEAWRISGMFNTRINYCRFDDKGFLGAVQIHGSDCHYNLSDKSYYPHNVDSVYDAATLHGVVAEFINDMLNRVDSDSS